MKRNPNYRLKRTSVPRGTLKKKVKTEKEQEEDEWLREYFEKNIQRSTWVCEECEGYIIHTEEWQQKSGQAHILPKNKYKEVKGIIDNRLHLCSSCHQDYDSSWLKASKMKVFSIAMGRLSTFAHLLIQSLPKGLLAVMNKDNGTTESTSV